MSRSCLGAAQTNSCTRWGYAMRPSPAAPCAVCEHTLPHSLSPGHCPGHTSAAWACWSSPTPQTRAANRCMPLTNPDNCCRNHTSRGTSSNSSTCTSTASSTSRPDLQSQDPDSTERPAGCTKMPARPPPQHLSCISVPEAHQGRKHALEDASVHCEQAAKRAAIVSTPPPPRSTGTVPVVQIAIHLNKPLKQAPDH